MEMTDLAGEVGMRENDSARFTRTACCEQDYGRVLRRDGLAQVAVSRDGNAFNTVDALRGDGRLRWTLPRAEQEQTGAGDLDDALYFGNRRGRIDRNDDQSAQSGTKQIGYPLGRVGRPKEN